jgi:2-methylcitrate dehydratase PrpD
MGMMDVLSRHLATAKFESLPVETVEITKKQILDTLAAMVGGSTCSIAGEIEALVEMVKGWGGSRESSLIGFGGRVPAPQAAFINGILAVRLDFDDTQVRGLRIHISRGIVPTALAMAERRKNISGKDLVTAVALGHDMSYRIRAAGGTSMESAFGMIPNFMGATAAAGKILGLNEAQFAAALGLTFHQISGAQSSPGTAGAGASIKGLNNGVACQTGITSALMAQMGFTGSLDCLEENNKRNFYQTFFRGVYLPQQLTAELGKVFQGTYASQKEYPSCHGQHASIEATLTLMKKDNIRAKDIAEVLLRVSPGDFGYLASPPEKKKSPQNLIETQFSLYWGVAAAICFGEATIRNFTAASLKDKKIWELMQKISTRPEPALESEEGFSGAIVEIKTIDGKTHTGRVDSPFGSPVNPMSMEDIAAKFRQCCRYAASPVSEENQEKVINLVKNIEQVKDVGRIARLVAP